MNLEGTKISVTIGPQKLTLLIRSLTPRRATSWNDVVAGPRVQSERMMHQSAGVWLIEQ